jgi:polar amino acid transport system substrate-binding protein
VFHYIVALILLTALMAVIPCLAADQTTSAKDLSYLTDPQHPPNTYQENGKLQGIYVDMLDNMWEKMGVDLNVSIIKLVPWTEGYQTALKENNTVLLATARIPEREKLFKWVGPVISSSYALLVKNNSNVSIKVLADLKKYKIGAIQDDAAAQLLQGQGVKKEDLILAATPTPIIKMLNNGTIDAWAYNDMSALWLIKQSGANSSDYKVAYTIGQSEGYYAFNNHTADSIVRSFQQALDYLKSHKDANGLSDYDKILSKYNAAT